MVGVGKQLVKGMIAELSWAKGIEAAQLSQHPTSLGKLFVDKTTYGL